MRSVTYIFDFLFSIVAALHTHMRFIAQYFACVSFVFGVALVQSIVKHNRYCTYKQTSYICICCRLLFLLLALLLPTAVDCFVFYVDSLAYIERCNISIGTSVYVFVVCNCC